MLLFRDPDDHGHAVRALLHEYDYAYLYPLHAYVDVYGCADVREYVHDHAHGHVFHLRGYAHAYDCVNVHENEDVYVHDPLQLWFCPPFISLLN